MLQKTYIKGSKQLWLVENCWARGGGLVEVAIARNRVCTTGHYFHAKCLSVCLFVCLSVRPSAKTRAERSEASSTSPGSKSTLVLLKILLLCGIVLYYTTYRFARVFASDVAVCSPFHAHDHVRSSSDSTGDQVHVQFVPQLLKILDQDKNE